MFNRRLTLEQLAQKLAKNIVLFLAYRSSMFNHSDASVKFNETEMNVLIHKIPNVSHKPLNESMNDVIRLTLYGAIAEGYKNPTYKKHFKQLDKFARKFDASLTSKFVENGGVEINFNLNQK